MLSISRPANPEKIKELKMEGSHISWDELTCIGYEVTDKEIKKLCEDIMKYRQEAGMFEAQKPGSCQYF